MNNQAVYIDATTAAGKDLQNRLSDDRVIRSIEHLLSKIETLENAVERLNVAMEQGPGLISMATDSIDEVIRENREKGINIEERLSNALDVAEKLTAPSMVEKLNELITFTEQAPGLISMITDSVDEAVGRSKQSGVDIEERLGAALQIAEKLTAPEMTAKIDNLLQLSDQAPGLIAMFVDSIDEEMAKAIDSGLDLNALKEMGQKLSSSLNEAQAMPEQQLGPFGVFRALRDSDRQKALGFLMNLAKAFGKNL